MNEKEKYIDYVSEKCYKLKKDIVNGDTDKVYELIVLTRSLAANLIEKHLISKAESKRIVRNKKKYYDITGKREETLCELSEKYNIANKCYLELLMLLGEDLWAALDLWETLGGSFENLCNLCNISYEKGLKYKRELGDHTFAEYIFITTMDYKNKGDFIEESPDAPLTFCIKEYMINQILHTKEGAKAAHKTFEKMFCSHKGSENDENSKGI